jgi:hypothetical protein
MYYKLICILYALLCGQNFILVKSGCYILQFLRTQNDQGKEYKPFFETFVRRKIVGHHED